MQYVASYYCAKEFLLSSLFLKKLSPDLIFFLFKDWSQISKLIFKLTIYQINFKSSKNILH